MYAFLRQAWPAMRLLLRLNISGDTPSQVVTKALLGYADWCAASTRYTLQLPHLQDLQDEEALTTPMTVLVPATDFSRLSHLSPTPRPHPNFTVGYVGIVDFVKMHPDFIQIAHDINVSDIRYVVRGGGGAHNTLLYQANHLGIADRVDIGGYVEDIGALYSQFDLFGYPLRSDNYGTADMVLHEAMFAGVPPVILAYGGTQYTVVHNHTGLVVNSIEEYQRAIEYLYHHPDERRRLGHNASVYAREHFGVENSVKALHRIYDEMLLQPKRVRRWQTHATASPMTSGAEDFIESLGPFAEAFQISLHAQEIDRLMAADQKIAEASSVLINPGGGGLFHYRTFYPNDGYLQLWAALVLYQQGHTARAIAGLRAALRCGCNHWRVHLYLARFATKLGNQKLASASIQQLEQLQSDFYRYL
jgi:hypothetical protein